MMVLAFRCLLGYWFIGIVMALWADQRVRREMFSVAISCAVALVWLPLCLMHLIERSSAHIKVDFDEKEDRTK